MYLETFGLKRIDLVNGKKIMEEDNGNTVAYLASVCVLAGKRRCPSKRNRYKQCHECSIARSDHQKIIDWLRIHAEVLNNPSIESVPSAGALRTVIRTKTFEGVAINQEDGTSNNSSSLKFKFLISER